MEERQEHTLWPTYGWEEALPESQGMDSNILMHLHALDQTLPTLLDDEYLFTLDEQKRAITLHHLLTMVSGMDNLQSGRYHFEGYTSYLQAVFATPLFCSPGQTFRYADPPCRFWLNCLSR